MDVRWIALAAVVCALLILMGALLKRNRHSKLRGEANSLFALAAMPLLGVALAFATGEIACYWISLALTAALFVLWVCLRVLKSR